MKLNIMVKCCREAQRHKPAAAAAVAAVEVLSVDTQVCAHLTSETAELHCISLSQLPNCFPKHNEVCGSSTGLSFPPFVKNNISDCIQMLQVIVLIQLIYKNCHHTTILHVPIEGHLTYCLCSPPLGPVGCELTGGLVLLLIFTRIQSCQPTEKEQLWQIADISVMIYFFKCNFGNLV